jgi:hemerythrin
MTPWNNPDWTSENPEIDAEHAKLNKMVSSLAAVVKNDATLGLSTEAVDILIERMKLHFGLEERSAAKIDAESCDILREDHAELLKLLMRVKDSMRQRDSAEAQTRLQAFVAALAKHDAEVDIPLFRMMAAAAKTSQG